LLGADTDNFTESSYFAVRGALAKTVTQATRYIAERDLLEEGAPVVARLAAQIASRFGVVVSQKVAAQAVPIIGALGGAAVNGAFMAHFQSVARAYFCVRRLERRNGNSAAGCLRAASYFVERVPRDCATLVMRRCSQRPLHSVFGCRLRGRSGRPAKRMLGRIGANTAEVSTL